MQKGDRVKIKIRLYDPELHGDSPEIFATITELLPDKFIRVELENQSHPLKWISKELDGEVIVSERMVVCSPDLYEVLS